MRNMLMLLKAEGTGEKERLPKTGTRRPAKDPGRRRGAIIGWTDIPVVIVAGVRLDAISQK
jgi:hypothetical protein